MSGGGARAGNTSRGGGGREPLQERPTCPGRGGRRGGAGRRCGCPRPGRHATCGTGRRPEGPTGRPSGPRASPAARAPWPRCTPQDPHGQRRPAGSRRGGPGSEDAPHSPGGGSAPRRHAETHALVQGPARPRSARTRPGARNAPIPRAAPWGGGDCPRHAPAEGSSKKETTAAPHLLHAVGPRAGQGRLGSNEPVLEEK